MLANAGAALSLAALWFFRGFRELLYPSDFRYFDFEVPRLFDYGAILLCVLILATAVFGALAITDQASSKWLGRAFGILSLMLGLAAFGSLSSEVITWYEPTAVRFVNLPLPFLVLLLCLAYARGERFSIAAIVYGLRSIALILLPFAAIVLLQTICLLVKGGEHPLEPQIIESTPVRAENSQVKNRMVWIIFDELGYATMMNRPDTVKMPAFEQLISESFFAKRAYPPDYDTRDSIPALLTGRTLELARPVASNDLKLFDLKGEGFAHLRESENTILDAKKIGGNVAISGWYHPYTRLFANELTYGYFQPDHPKSCFSLGACTKEVFEKSLENVPFMYRTLIALGVKVFRDQNQSAVQIARNEFLRDKALKIVADPKLDLIFFHFSIPHSPFINKKDEPAKRGYWGALEAVDRSLREIRERLEATGEWDRTTLIVSADHWWRSKIEDDFMHLPAEKRREVVQDTRVPYIVKLPHHAANREYEPAFNTVITRHLIGSIMRGDINSAEELTRWLDEMRQNRPDITDFKPETSGN